VALLDVNVLLALAWPNHQHHGAAHAWFHREAGRGWATCALTQLGFIRLSSNPAYTPAPATPRAAATLLGQLTAHSAHDYWADLAEPASLGFASAPPRLLMAEGRVAITVRDGAALPSLA
jgi:toxin-antitoxin system PIN domain toxin